VRRRQPIDDVLPPLCEQLRPQFRRILSHFRIPVEDAEDLVQTTLLLAVMKWPVIESLAPWLLGTLEKRCVMYWRSRRLQGGRFVAIEPVQHKLATPPDQERQDLLADLKTLCGRLPWRQRAVVALYCGQDLSQQDVARATGIRPSSVRKTAHRALTQLRRAARCPAPAPHRPLPRFGPASPWSVPMDAFFAARALVGAARRNYVTQLARAAAALGDRPLAELTVEALGGYRAVVLTDRRGSVRQADALAKLRSFLLWAGEHDLHTLPPAVVQAALRPPRWRPSRPRFSAGSPWSVAADAFFAASTYVEQTRQTYTGELARAAAALGDRPLTELTADALANYRATVVADGRAPSSQADTLSVLRLFMLWAGERGWHSLAPATVQATLGLPRGYARPFITWVEAAHARAQAAVQAGAVDISPATSAPQRLRGADRRRRLSAAAVGQVGGNVAQREKPRQLPAPAPTATRAIPVQEPQAPSVFLAPAATPAAGPQPLPRPHRGEFATTIRTPRHIRRLVTMLVQRFAESSRSRRQPRPTPALAWRAASDAFLDSFRGPTHSSYRSHLAEAATLLGRIPGAELTRGDLAAYRAALLADGRPRHVHLQALSVLRSFLLWQGREGGHPVEPGAVLAALPLPRSAARP
jgi:RNA polymerase sigma factor (sigma-70 family)